jgi:hypothetical protein
VFEGQPQVRTTRGASLTVPSRTLAEIMSYKIIYHCGNEINLKTRTKSGRLNLESDSLIISGKESISIPVECIVEVEMFRLQGLGRMLKVVHSEGTIFLTVVRFCLFDLFAMVNFLKTGKLHRELETIINKDC